MRVLLPAAAVPLLAACAQVFGIADTTAAKGEATLAIERVSVGGTVSVGPQDLSMQTATFYLPADATTLDAVPGAMTATGTWSAQVQGTPFVAFTLPDLPMPVDHVWALPSTQVAGDFIAHEHADPQPAFSTSQVALAINLPTQYQTTEALEVYVVGAWASYVLTGLELPGSGATAIATTIPYAMFSTVTESPAVAIDASDVVLVLRSLNAQLTGVYQTSFDQTAGTDNLTGNMLAVDADQMFAGPIDPTTVSTRLSAARPSVNGPAVTWDVRAAPGYEHGDTAGPSLVSGAVATGGTSIAAMYGNPFESLGWPAIATVSLTEGRSYTFMGAPLLLGATVSVIGQADGLQLDFAAPIPEQVNLDDNQLVIDGATVTIDATAAHQMTLQIENRPAQLYELSLYDLTVSSTSVAAQLVLDAVATDPTFTIPPDFFQDGHTYIPAARTISSGFPNAGDGDLQQRTLPVETAVFEGGVFTVNP
ncbi:MAG TPA: hypothetical protein VMJ10_33490 [Kofleriaceae bacterium]|nr:hypothetical protein [Kofleriaceae bacterium]